MFNPLLFADWRSIARRFTLVCWVIVVVLGWVIAAHLGHSGSVHQHGVRHVVVGR
jgi:hypothetical protein